MRTARLTSPVWRLKNARWSYFMPSLALVKNRARSFVVNAIRWWICATLTFTQGIWEEQIKLISICLKANKNCYYSANFQNVCKIFLLHGASLCGFHISFWYHSNLTWNDWDMAKICSAGVFAPPPWIVSSGPTLDRVKHSLVMNSVYKKNGPSYFV